MKSILVVSRDPSVYSIIQKSINNVAKTGNAKSKAEALAIIKGTRYDYVFIDIDALSKEGKRGEGEENKYICNDLSKSVTI